MNNVLDAATQGYLKKLVQTCQNILGDLLVGLYLHGSAAQDDYKPGKSDLDILGICSGPILDKTKDELAAQLSHSHSPIPASGLEFVLITQETAQNPSPSPAYEFSFSSGAKWKDEVEKQGHAPEILISSALSREHGIPLFGPEPKAIFSPIPENWISNALIKGLEWHKSKILDDFHDPLGQYSVLNACRAWRFAEEKILCSKTKGAEWVLSKKPENNLAKEALAIRQGKRTTPLDPGQIDAFLSQVIQILTAPPPTRP